MNQDSTNFSESKALTAEETAEIRRLTALVDRELEKPIADQDDRLIDDCIERIAKIKGVRSTFSEEEIAEKLVRVKAMAAAKQAAARSPRRAMRTALIAACLVVVLVASALTAYATVPSVRSWVDRALNLSTGESVDGGGVVYTNMGESRKFDSIDELLAAEGIEIYYPGELPEGVCIKNIVYMDINGIDSYSIGFNTDDISIYVMLDHADSFVPGSYHEVYSNSAGTFYITQTNGLFTITGIIGQDTYDITIKNISNEKIILDSLKESVT